MALYFANSHPISIIRTWELEVCVLEGKQLAPKDGDTSDPYVTVALYNAAGTILFKGQTSKIPKTLNPRWNHIFSKIPEEAKNKFYRMEFNVWDHDYVGYNDFMGRLAPGCNACLLVPHLRSQLRRMFDDAGGDSGGDS